MSSSRLSLLSLAVLGVVLLPGASAVGEETGATATTPTGACEPRWDRVPSPKVSGGLTDISFAGEEAWAVGSGGTLIEHWDGRAWSEFPSPAVDYLRGVVAVSSTEAWAVGTANDAMVILRWDGFTWTIAHQETGWEYGSSGWEISASPAGDVWAVGKAVESSDEQYVLAAHWDGATWYTRSFGPPAEAGDYVEPHGVTVLSPTDVWVVGASDYAFVAHWDGAVWTRSLIRDAQLFEDVVAIASNDVWAVGRLYVSPIYVTVIMHWDGLEWKVVPSPNRGTGDNFMNAVAASGTSNVWAVGSVTLSGISQTLIQHWNGRTWSLQSSPNHRRRSAGLSGVTLRGPTDVWAVGGSGGPLILSTCA